MNCGSRDVKQHVLTVFFGEELFRAELKTPEFMVRGLGPRVLAFSIEVCWSLEKLRCSNLVPLWFSMA